MASNDIIQNVRGNSNQKYPRFSYLRPLNITLNFSSGIKFIEHVQLTLSLKAPERGRVSIILKSPSNTFSEIVPNRALDFSNIGFKRNTFMSVKYWGENPNGEWSVLVIYDDPKDVSSSAKYLSYCELVVHGMKRGIEFNQNYV